MNHLSEEHKQKISFSCKGRVPWNRGISFSDVARRNMSLAHEGTMRSADIKRRMSLAHVGEVFTEDRKKKMSLGMKARWKTPGYAKKVLHRRESSYPERVFIGLCEERQLPYCFVGNGALDVDGKNPDFVGILDDHKLIEIWGERWHRGQNPQDRIDFFNNRGYDCMVIMAAALKRDPESVIQAVQNYGRKHEQLDD
jgi:very-short-patch-repair endonuclease